MKMDDLMLGIIQRILHSRGLVVGACMTSFPKSERGCKRINSNINIFSFILRLRPRRVCQRGKHGKGIPEQHYDSRKKRFCL